MSSSWFPFRPCSLSMTANAAPAGRQAGSGDAARLLAGGAAFAVCLVLTLVSAQSARSLSFPLDHAVKLVLFLIGIESLSQALCGLERLAGFDTSPIIDRSFLSAHPGRVLAEVQPARPRLVEPERVCPVRRDACAGAPESRRSFWSAPHCTSWRLESPRRVSMDTRRRSSSSSAGGDALAAPGAPVGELGLDGLGAGSNRDRLLDGRHLSVVLPRGRSRVSVDLCQPAVAP